MVPSLFLSPDITSELRRPRGLRRPDLPNRHLRVPDAIAIGRRKFEQTSLHRNHTKSRNINRLCIDYPFRARLSSRLTHRRFALLWKPWVYGGRGSHPSFCYSCQHSLFTTLHRASRRGFNADANALLPLLRHKRKNPQLRYMV